MNELYSSAIVHHNLNSENIRIKHGKVYLTNFSQVSVNDSLSLEQEKWIQMIYMR